PRMYASAGIDAHAGRNPAHPVLDPEFAHEFERRPVGLADEMVVALERQPAEVEVGGHPAGYLVRLVNDDPVVGLLCMIGGGETHCACADNGNTFHVDIR